MKGISFLGMVVFVALVGCAAGAYAADASKQLDSPTEKKAQKKDKRQAPGMKHRDSKDLGSTRPAQEGGVTAPTDQPVGR